MPEVTLGDHVVIEGRSVPPTKMGNDVVAVMSLPAYDNWETPEISDPMEIGSAKSKVLEPCVLVSKLNPRIPRVWYVPEVTSSLYASPEFLQIRPSDNSIELRFLYYVLLSSTKELARSVRGTTGSHQRIGREDILRLRFQKPDMTEQINISAKLGALDDKIASNRRKIRLLEDLGSTLVAEELVLDEFGMPIFDGTLGARLTVLETGSRPRGGVSEITEGIPSLGAENIQSAGVMSSTALKFVPDGFALQMRRGHLVDEDILVYKDGGKPGNFVPHVSAYGHGFPTERATINEHVYRVRGGGGVSQALLYWLLQTPWMNLEMRKRGTGVAIPGLNMSNFRELPFPELSADRLEMLCKTLDPMLTLMLRLGKQNLRLEVLRDALLPEFLSGRFWLPEATEGLK